MVEIKNYNAWSHTSAILAMILNVNKDCKKHGTTPFDAFNPYANPDKGLKVAKVVSKAESERAFALMKTLWFDNAPEYKVLAQMKARKEAEEKAKEKDIK